MTYDPLTAGRRAATVGMGVSALVAAAVGAAQLVVAGSVSITSETLSMLGYTAQFAVLTLLALVLVARPAGHVVGWSTALFAATMFMPVLHKHSAGIPLVGATYVANMLLVTVLALAVVRAASARLRGAEL
ncbi:hypothetical protein [Prescottella defluvii]|uniref:hypothetical protein n=1 Tax=Prescottella defluvii TaxID=1323361 RepID=UPI000AD1D8C7|nr:hypothetical protein [Prescottella defluvii]